MASRQFASVTPKVSSTASERKNPGVIASAVTRWAWRSAAIAWASRMTAFFARS